MTMKGMKQKILLAMTRKIELHTEKKNLLSVFLLLAILMLSLGMIQGTMGKFSQSATLTDSATAAGFDVIITPPKEFWPEEGGSSYEYHFLSDVDIQGLVFEVTNNGETSVLCRPYIDGDITYRVYVGEEVVTDFSVAASETVTFWLVIAPDGLDTNVINTKFFVDIQQMEGG